MSDIMQDIDRYFATVSDEDFLHHLTEAGFVVVPRTDDERTPVEEEG